MANQTDDAAALYLARLFQRRRTKNALDRRETGDEFLVACNAFVGTTIQVVIEDGMALASVTVTSDHVSAAIERLDAGREFGVRIY